MIPASTLPPVSHRRLKRLLSHGYFPAELPVPFTTRDFGRHAVDFASSWDGKEIRRYWTVAESYNVPRYGHARRKLSVVNPVNQLHVADLISDNWSSIAARLQRSKITEFKPEITELGPGRAVVGIDFEGVAQRRAEILSSYGRYVRTDVARFYPSVYTHAIPWALLGKDWVKANMHSAPFKSGYENHLDAAVRAGQEGQTIGLPIGPDTSRILSELIATEIEQIASSTLTDLSHRAVRYVDDMYIGLRESEATPSVLSHISSALYEYELDLNAEKTVVVGVGLPHSPEWIHYIRTFELSDKKSRQRADLDSFFEHAFYLADANSRDNVLLFATKRAVSFRLDDTHLAHLTRWLMYAARRSPTCLSFVAEHLASMSSTTLFLPELEIHAYILEQIPIKAGFAHTDEVAWLIFWAREIGLSIPSALLSKVLTLRSSVVALLTLDLNQRGLISGAPLDTSFWESFATSDGLRSEMWLLVYEATKKGWWPKSKPSALVTSATFFQDLWAKDVEFYDPTKKARRRLAPVFVSPVPSEVPDGADTFDTLDIGVSTGGYPE